MCFGGDGVAGHERKGLELGNVLLGWELGDDPGHATRLVEIARPLVERGHRLHLVVRDVPATSLALDGLAISVMQAPMQSARGHARNRTGSYATYADQLALAGFARARDLLAMTGAWQALIDLVRPDAIVCENSPALALAAFASIPIMFVGDGFGVPPAQFPQFPPIRRNVEPTRSHENVLAAVQEVQRINDRPVPETLPALFNSGTRYVCCLPELAPYLAIREDAIVGPVGKLPAPAPAPEDRRFVALLDAFDPEVESLVTSLARAALPGAVYSLGLPRPLVALLTQRGIEFHDSSHCAQTVLSRASVVLHHGDLGMTETAFALGRLQVVVPRSIEQSFNATVLENRSIGIRLGDKVPTSAVGETLRKMINAPNVCDRTLAWARTVHEDGPSGAKDVIVSRCLDLLA